MRTVEINFKKLRKIRKERKLTITEIAQKIRIKR